jgi:hypothetical protein
MPMRPAARADRLVGLLARLDLHVGYEALVLPACEILPHDRLGLALARQILLCDGGKKSLLPPPAKRLVRDPLNAGRGTKSDFSHSRSWLRLLVTTTSGMHSCLTVAIAIGSA